MVLWIQEAIYEDKGYIVSRLPNVRQARKGCRLAAIKKNNMKDKNAD